jgi:hypothetical protein
MKVMQWLAVPRCIQWEIYAGGKITNAGGKLAIGK